MNMKQPVKLGVLSGSIEPSVKVLVHTKSIPETVLVMHVSSAFLLAAPATRASAWSSVPSRIGAGCVQAGRVMKPSKNVVSGP
jgi:hypothetical protein